MCVPKSLICITVDIVLNMSMTFIIMIKIFQSNIFDLSITVAGQRSNILHYKCTDNDVCNLVSVVSLPSFMLLLTWCGAVPSNVATL